MTKLRLAFLAPVVGWATGFLGYLPLTFVTMLGPALMLPWLLLLIRCRRCDEYVIESVHRAPGHGIPVLFFTPYLRCVKCGATLGKPWPYDE